MARGRTIVGLVTLLALVAIGLGVSGAQLPSPGGQSERPLLPGVRVAASSTLLRVGAGAPPGGELAFMTVEANGNLVVSDSKRGSVLRFDPNGQLLTEWGPRLGPGAQLVEPAGVAVAEPNYYVLDRGMPRIFRLDSNGQLQATFNLEQLSPYGLNGLAVDAAGNIYAADTGRNRVLVFTPNGQFVKQIGHAGNDLGGFTQPMMLAFARDGTFFVADWENSRIERFSSGMEALDAFTLGFHAFGVAVDQTGRVFAPDFEHRRVEAYTPQGASLGEIGGPDSPLIEVAPKQVAIAPGGQPSLYVLGAGAIQRLDLQNTPPPPQDSSDTDVVSVLAIVVMLGLVGLAVVTRRRRQRAPALLGATLDGPVELQSENGAQGKAQQAQRDQELLIANQSERKQ